MPQFASNLTVNDGTATPVAVVFAPERLSTAETTLVDRREASRDMQPSINIAFQPANANRATYKVVHDIALPLIRSENGVPLVKDIARARVTYTIPKTATVQERKHLRAFLANLEDNTLVKAGVEDLDPIY